MGVSENDGTPKSSILIGCSIINHPFWGTSILETPIYDSANEHLVGGWELHQGLLSTRIGPARLESWGFGSAGRRKTWPNSNHQPRTQRIRFFWREGNETENFRIFGSHARSRLPTFVGLAFAGEGDGVWMMGERPHGSCGHKNDQWKTAVFFGKWGLYTTTLHFEMIFVYIVIIFIGISMIPLRCFAISSTFVAVELMFDFVCHVKRLKKETRRHMGCRDKIVADMATRCFSLAIHEATEYTLLSCRTCFQ